MARYPWPDKVHPEMVRLFDLVYIEAYQSGVTIVPYFGYRDEPEQTALYAQGRQPLAVTNSLRAAAGLPPITEDQNKRIVTKAKYGQSAHTVEPARAVDCYVLDPLTGKAVWWDGADLDDDGQADYHEVGLIGEKFGLVWGGRFAMKDWGHFEMPRPWV